MKQNGRIRANRNSVTAGILGAESVQTEQLMLAFKDPDITINTQCYCRDFRTAIKTKHPDMPTRDMMYCTRTTIPTLQDTLHFMHCIVMEHPLYILDLSPCDFHVFSPLKRSPKVIHTGWMKTSRLHWHISSSNSPGSYLQRGSTGCCINGMPASVPMGTVFDGLYSFEQNNLQMGFI
jgi:hypothetical protein